MISSHASYQPCAKVLSNWVKLPYSSQKKFIVLLIYIVYCIVQTIRHT